MPKKQTKQQCINHPDVESIFDSLCKECIQEFADQGNQVYREYLQTIKEMETAQKKKKKKKHVEGPDFFEFLADAVQQKLDLWFSGTDDFYYYEKNSGLWRSHADIAVKSILTDIRRGMKSDEDSHKKEKITTIFKEVIAVLKGRLAPKMQSMPVPDKRYIPLGNGIFDLETEELLPYTKNFFFTTKIPWNYNPESKCDRFSEMMDDWYTKEKVITGWEIMALCLFRGYPIHKFFVLYSGGGQGKSTYMKVLRHMLGTNNVCSIALDKLNDQFTTIGLHTKYANLADELSPEKFSNTETLKMATGESLIQARAIYKAPIKFENYATVVFSLNPEDRFPESNDKTRGFYRRLCMIEFKGAKATKSPIIGLAESIIDNREEMEGILYKSLMTLKKLRSDGWKMELDEDAETVKKKHLAESNPLQIFVNEYCDRSDNYSVEVNDFMRSLNMFLKAIGKKPFSSYGMKSKMEKLEVFKKRESYSQNYSWIGISINEAKLKKLITENENSDLLVNMGLDAIAKVQNLKREISKLLKAVPDLSIEQLMGLTGASDKDLVCELKNEIQGNSETASNSSESVPF